MLSRSAPITAFVTFVCGTCFGVGIAIPGVRGGGVARASWCAVACPILFFPWDWEVYLPCFLVHYGFPATRRVLPVVV